MEHLDADDSVATYGYETVVIQYLSNKRTGKLRRYYPDFLVTYADGRQELIEIKPKSRVGQAKVQKKVQAAEVWCQERGIRFVVLTEVELKSMGVLTG